MATDRIRIDPSVVRGLEYYTGPVYEVELLLETKDEKGRPVRFGSVGGGGRYDGLVSRFRGEPVPATGFSIGVSRLQAALDAARQARQQAGARPGGGHGVRPRPHRRLPADGGGAAQRRHPRRAVSRQPEEVRPADEIRRQARQRPASIIQGGDEKAKGEVQIKDLILGATLPAAIKDRDDYLKKQAEAQFAVPETKLVEAVRRCWRATA